MLSMFLMVGGAYLVALIALAFSITVHPRGDDIELMTLEELERQFTSR